MAEITGSEAPVDARDSAERALRAQVDDWRRRYGTPVADLRVVAAAGDGLVVEGEVLVRSQAEAALAAARQAAGVPVGSRLRVLADADDHHGWLAAIDVVDVWAAPGGDLATQAAPDDPPMRRLARRGDWWAVELADGTVGWVRSGDGAPLDGADAPAVVADWRAAFAGTARPVPAASWREALAGWLGVPYLWGGTTRRGVDCSGLTQRIYRTVAGLGLPRHSRDQARAGRRVDPAAVGPGDLLYLTRRDGGIGHVAIVLDGPDGRVGHAGRESGVVEEDLPDLLSRYQLRAARRVVPEDGS